MGKGGAGEGSEGAAEPGKGLQSPGRRLAVSWDYSVLSDCFRFQISRCNSIWQVRDLIYLSLIGCFWSLSLLCAGPRDPFVQLLLRAVMTSRTGVTSRLLVVCCMLSRTSSSLQQKPRHHQWSVAAAPGWCRHTSSYLVSPRFTRSYKKWSLECPQQDPECAQCPQHTYCSSRARPGWKRPPS